MTALVEPESTIRSTRRLRLRRGLSAEEVAEIRAIGDNTGSMALKGAAPGYDGEAAADRWPLTDELSALAGRWGIEPERDLVKTPA